MTIVRTLRTDTNFDEFVCFERGIDCGNDSVGQAVFAKLNERIEVVSERSQVSSLLTGQAHGLSANDRRKIEGFRAERLVLRGKPVKFEREILHVAAVAPRHVSRVRTHVSDARIRVCPLAFEAL